MDDATTQTDTPTRLEVADQLEAITGSLDDEGKDRKRLAGRLKALKEGVQQWTQAVRLLAPDESKEKQVTLDALANLHDCVEGVERLVGDGESGPDLKALLEQAREAERQLHSVSQIAESLRESLLADDDEAGAPKRGDA